MNAELPIKMIAMDLDDTLLGPDLSISQGNKDALDEAAMSGVTLVLASGRPTAGMMKAAGELNLKDRGGWIVSYNGAQIYNCAKEEVFWEKSLSRVQALEILDLSRREGLTMLTYLDGKILTPTDNPWAKIEKQLTGLNVRVERRIEDLLPPTVPKIIVLGEPEVLREKLPRIQRNFGEEWNISLSKPFFMEFTAHGIEKGSALQRLAEYLEILPSQAMALGDGHNDMTMIQWAGTGVAMDNGVTALKQAADWVTGHHAHDGVAQAVRKFCLGTLK